MARRRTSDTGSRALRRVRLVAVAAMVALTSTMALPVAHAEPSGSGVLDAWHAALARSTIESADVVFIGDSITQGFGAPTRGEWWIELVSDRMQSAWGGRGSGYRPASPDLWPSDPRGWSLVDGVNVVTTGLGLRAYALTDPAAELKTTVGGERFELLYAEGPERGAMEIAVDGVVVATIDTSSTEPIGGQVWSSSDLGAGPHEVRVRGIYDGEHRLPVVVEGLQASSGPGVRVWDAGHGGYGSSHFVEETGWVDGLRAADPDLVVIALGSNDYGSDLTAGQFEANLASIVDAVREAADTPVSIALMPLWRGRGRDLQRQNELVEAQRRLADERGLALIDLSQHDSRVVTDDGLHPNTIGQQVVASAVLDLMDPSFDIAAQPGPPADPTSASASVDVATGDVHVAWQASPSGASGYAVLAYDLSTGVVVSRRTVGGTATSFALSPGRYVFGVHAGNAMGFSRGIATNVVSASAPAPPGDPTAVAARHDLARGIEVSWTPPAEPVVDYTVLAYDLASGRVVHVATVTDPSLTVALPPGRYVFGVHSRNGVGYSSGAASKAIDVPSVAPADPTAVAATTSGTDVEVSWSPAAGAVRDYAVLAYDLSNGHVAAHMTVTSTSASFSLPAGRYVFGVHAGSDSGYSAGVASNVVVHPG